MTTQSERTIGTYARPGDLLRFECHDCAEFYRLTVQPRRNVSRALKRLEEGNLDRVKELLVDALDELQNAADFMNERGKDG